MLCPYVDEEVDEAAMTRALDLAMLIAVARGKLVLFFQAEEGIRGATVTGVQTCALPISRGRALSGLAARQGAVRAWVGGAFRRRDRRDDRLGPVRALRRGFRGLPSGPSSPR